MNGRLVLALAMVTGAVIAPAPAAVAQDGPVELAELVGKTVGAVEVVGAADSITTTAREALVLRVGQPYSIGAVRDSLQNLHALGSVSQVEVEVESGAGGVSVRFRVTPQLRLWEVRFTGDLPIRRSQLQRELGSREGQPLNARIATREAARIQQALSDQGYLLSQVEASIEPLQGTRARLRLDVRPGPRTQLQELRVNGPAALPAGLIRTTLGLLPGQPYRPAELEAGLDRLDALYVQRHHFFHTLQVAEQSLDLDSNGMSLVLEIDAGPRVDLTISGTGIDEPRLHSLLSIFEFGTVADWALKESRHQLVRFLQDRGYWRPLVSYSRQRDTEGRNARVQVRVLPGRKHSLDRVAFTGNEAIADEELLALIRTGDRSLLRGARFRSEFWDADQRAVETAFRRQGFRGASVTDAPVGLEGDELVARMVIDQGPRTLVREVDLRIESQGQPTPGIAPQIWAGQLEQRPGGPYDPTAVRRDADRLRALLSNVGYPRAMVDSRVDREDESATVSYVLHPGDRARVTRVVIAGNETTREHVIRRELGFIPGSPWAFADVLDTQSRLYRLGIFDEVDIDPAQPDAVGTDRDVIVRVHEAPPKYVSFGIGYDTEERLRGLLAVGHNNIGGRNQQLSLSTRLSTREQRVRMLFREPWFLGRRVEATTGLFYTNENEPSFDVQRYGGSFQILLQRNEAVNHIWRLTFRDINTFNIKIDPGLVDREDQATRVGSLGYTILRDTRTDPIDPRDGSYNTFDVDVATRFLGSNTDFVTLFGRSFWYRQLGRGVILALAARAGIKIPYRTTVNVPLPERFFAGGSTTLRGFQLDRAGPIDSNGNPLGGEVLLVGNVEFRVPIRGQLGAVFFADIGNVFGKPSDITFGEIRESFGLGVRWRTPVGPLRLDVARLLDRREFENSYQLFFSVGHTF